MPRPWLRLDNAAKIFPAATGIRDTQAFRLAARLTEPVDPHRLQAALDAVLPRFPVFQMRLKPGFFWFSLEFEPRPARIVADTRWPCMPLRKDHDVPHLFRVRWFGCRIAVEFHHSLSDGTGGLVFLRALLAAYASPGFDTTGLAGSAHDQSEDAFLKLRDPHLPPLPSASRAFLLPAKLARLGVYHVTTGRLPLGPVLAVAKAAGLTLTEFLAATALMSFQDAFEALPPRVRSRRAKPLRLSIPVNLRKPFPSKTLRNFFAVVPVEIDLRLGHYTFEEAGRKVHHQLQAEMDPKLLRKQVMRNLRGEEHPIGRYLPLAVKNLILGTVSGTFDARQTSSVSNLGAVADQPEFCALVRDFEFVPPPTAIGKLKLGVVSFGNTLSLTWGNLTETFAIERYFFTRLRRQGLPVALESNRLFPED